MVPAKETAEEQLLRMIEGPGGPRSARAPQRGFSPRQLVQRIRARSSVLWPFAPAGQANQDQTDGFLRRMHVAERFLWVVLAGLGVYLAADLVLIKRRLPAVAMRATPEAGSHSSSQPVMAEDQLKPLAEYREAIMARNPFGSATKGAGESAGGQGSKGKLAELTASLSVVGINRGAVPEALIEDAGAQRTHFVKVGDQVNGLTVKSIDQRGVTLTYEDEELTLQ